MQASVERRRNTISQLDLKAINLTNEKSSGGKKARDGSNIPQAPMLGILPPLPSHKPKACENDRHTIEVKDRHIKRLENQIKILLNQMQSQSSQSIERPEVAAVKQMDQKHQDQINRLKKVQMKMKNIANIEEAEAKKLEEKARKLRDEADAVVE